MKVFFYVFFSRRIRVFDAFWFMKSTFNEYSLVCFSSENLKNITVQIHDPKSTCTLFPLNSAHDAILRDMFYSVGSDPLGIATLRRSKNDLLLELRTLGYKNSYSIRLSLCDSVIKTYANCSLSACLVSRISVLS